MAMDVEHSKSMNMLEDAGFLASVYHATCIKPGGGCLAAPVCSSFVYMSLGRKIGHSWFVHLFGIFNIASHIWSSFSNNEMAMVCKKKGIFTNGCRKEGSQNGATCVYVCSIRFRICHGANSNNTYVYLRVNRSQNELRNTGTSKRSVTRPLGEEKYTSVREGNILCARTLVILWIVASLQVWFILEQPQGSWMECHPCFQHLASALDIYRHRISMHEYGGSSSKPTWLYSSYLSMKTDGMTFARLANTRNCQSKNLGQ